MGKAILFLVIGLSTTLVFVNQNHTRLSTIAAENIYEHYEQANVHNAALSGANIGCSSIFWDPRWNGDTTLAFDGCKVSVKVEVLDAERNIKRINSIASKPVYTPLGKMTVKDTVMVTLRPSNFSKFAYYSADEGGTIYWTTGDTVWGPFHTQDRLLVSGRPVFLGMTTNKLGLQKKNSSDNPYFPPDKYETNVHLPIDEDAISDLYTTAQSGGFVFPSSNKIWVCTHSSTTHSSQCSKGSWVNEDIETVYLSFEGNSIKYKYNDQSSWTTVTASNLSPNGVIYIQDAELRVKGIKSSGGVKGKYTVVCSGTSGSNGNVYLDDDLVYNVDPSADPTAQNLLGLVAERSVWISNNSANNSSINIHASIYCQDGGFGAEAYSTRPVSGNINLIGGIIQKTRAAVGTFSGSTINHGFNKRYKYDDRFMFNAPPKYPNTGSYEILSWYE